MNGFITKTEVEQNKEFIVETWGLDFFNICMKSEGKTLHEIRRENFFGNSRRIRENLVDFS